MGQVFPRPTAVAFSSASSGWIRAAASPASGSASRSRPASSGSMAARSGSRTMRRACALSCCCRKLRPSLWKQPGKERFPPRQRRRTLLASSRLDRRGYAMDGQLCERVSSAPVLPARAKADALIAHDLIDRLRDEKAAQALAAHFADYPRSTELVAGLLAHSPFLAQVMRLDPEGLLASLTLQPEARRDALLGDI